MFNVLRTNIYYCTDLRNIAINIYAHYNIVSKIYVLNDIYKHTH